MNHAIESQYPFKRSTSIQLRFNDLDSLGHVNNSIYFQFFFFFYTEYIASINVDVEIECKLPALIFANV